IESSPVFVESNDSVREVMNAAYESAGKSRRVYIDSVDMLLALLCESKGIASRALSNMGIECTIVERTLRETVSRDEPTPVFFETFTSIFFGCASGSLVIVTCSTPLVSSAEIVLGSTVSGSEKLRETLP